MPRGVPKALQARRAHTQAMVETVTPQTEGAQVEQIRAELDQVAQFQVDLEAQLPTHFQKLVALRDGDFDKESAPGAKVNLDAMKVMMENTHRLHPDKMGVQGERVTVNVLVQLLAAPES